MVVDTKHLDYRPVSLAKNEIRLLEIQAASDLSDPIVARLVTVRVTEDLEFIGVSALVGDLNEMEYMWVNGSKVNIPANIGEALRNVRAVFRRDSSSLYQVDSNTSSQTHLPTATATATIPSSGPPLSPSPQARPPAPLSKSSTNNSSSSKPSRNSYSSKKTPGWLKNLLRGFQTLLPDHPGGGSGRCGGDSPLRVWLDCLCLDQRNVQEEQQRRAHMALAYGAAKLVVGWLGPKDETTDLAVANLRTIDVLTPATFGEPGDRAVHPEHYGPHMDFLRPLGEAWRAGNLITTSSSTSTSSSSSSQAQTTDRNGGNRKGNGNGNGEKRKQPNPREGIYFKSAQNFLMRPFFHRQWILEEVATMSQFPAFLVGDEIVSWMQVLRWNRINEEFKERGCVHMPDDVKIIAELLDIGTVHTLLEDFHKRTDQQQQQQQQNQRGGGYGGGGGLLFKVSSSTESSSGGSTGERASLQSSRRPASQARASKHLTPKYGV